MLELGDVAGPRAVAVLQLSGRLRAGSPTWYVVLQGAAGVIQFAAPLWPSSSLSALPRRGRMGEGQLTCGGDEVERGGEEAPERPGSRACDQVGDKRGRANCQADGEQMQAAPDHGMSRLGCESLRDPPSARPPTSAYATTAPAINRSASAADGIPRACDKTAPLVQMVSV